jgi:hypothetical protein
MRLSRQEEIISALYLIAALLAFNGGHIVCGWILAAKAALNCVISIRFAYYEVARKEEQGE